jgi:hypothetical protein
LPDPQDVSCIDPSAIDLAGLIIYCTRPVVSGFCVHMGFKDCLAHVLRIKRKDSGGYVFWGAVSKTGYGFQKCREFWKLGGVSKGGYGFQNRYQFPKLAAVSKTGRSFQNWVWFPKPGMVSKSGGSSGNWGEFPKLGMVSKSAGSSGNWG